MKIIPSGPNQREVFFVETNLFDLLRGDRMDGYMVDTLFGPPDRADGSHAFFPKTMFCSPGRYTVNKRNTFVNNKDSSEAHFQQKGTRSLVPIYVAGPLARGLRNRSVSKKEMF
jgi:hypothetical protein